MLIMKKISTFLLVATLLTLCSCSSGNFAVNKFVADGENSTKEYTLTAFNTVNVSNNFDVEIVEGNQNKVVVSVPANIIDYVDIHVTDNCLFVSYTENMQIDKNGHEFKVHVTMPELVAADASGQSQIVSRLTRYNDLKVDCSGQSAFEFAGKAITCNELNIAVSGQSEVEADGITCNSFDAKSSGQADIKIEMMKADTVDAKASGQAEIEFGQLDCTTVKAEASGQSEIKARKGNRVTVQQNVSGQASVIL